MNPNEQQTEDRVDTVLAALRHARPAPGMEVRITAALARQADEASRAKPRWRWLRMPQLAGAAVVVAATLLVAVLIHRQAATAPGKDYVARRLLSEGRAEKAAGFGPLSLAPAGEGLQPRPTSAGAKAPLRSKPGVSGLKATAFSKDTDTATCSKHTIASTCSKDTIAAFSKDTITATPAGRCSRGLPAVISTARVSTGSFSQTGGQTCAPLTGNTTPATRQAQAEQGFPAPPLPLTEQERLLVRLVHREDPVQLAQLTPAAREAELQRDHEQVLEFFKAPPMLAANFKLEPYPTPGGTQ